MMNRNQITDYLQTIAATLPGPAAARADILAELRDGLLTARELNERAGMDPTDAVNDALSQYGDPSALARSFWPELAMVRARRTVLALFVTGPIVAALWLSAVSALPDHDRSHALFSGAATHTPALLLFAAILGSGGWTLALTGKATRWLHPSPRASLLGAATMAMITAVSDLVALALFITLSIGAPRTSEKLALATAIVVSTIRLAVASRAGRSCFRSRSAEHTASA